MIEYIAHLLVLVGIYSILSLSLNLIIGFTGMLNLGHVAFFALGAYTSTLLVKELHLPFIVGLCAGALVAAAFGFMISLPCMRLRGDYLAIATLGFAEVINAIIRNWVSLTRGPLGISAIPHARFFMVFDTPEKFLVLVSFFVVCTFLIMHRITTSPFGRVLKAIREDDIAAQALGKDIVHFKVLVFAIGAFFAGIAGSLFAHYNTYIDPSFFNLIESVLLVWMVVIGGLGSLWGSLLGSTVLIVLYEPLRFLCSSFHVVCFPTHIESALRLVLWSVIVIIMMHQRPSGFLGEKRFKAGEAVKHA